MIGDWIKRAWRWFCRVSGWDKIGQPLRTDPVGDLRPGFLAAYAEGRDGTDAYRRGIEEALIAQKNVELSGIARTRNVLKDEIARLKRNKKKSSHLEAKLSNLTRRELEIEGGK